MIELKNRPADSPQLKEHSVVGEITAENCILNIYSVKSTIKGAMFCKAQKLFCGE